MARSSSHKHEAARRWAERGFAVFPTHWTDPAGACSCGEADCGRAGKHPLVKGGVHQATTDLARIDEWWSKYPEANIACSPDASGCFALDLDMKGDKDGVASLAALTDEHGQLPETFTTRTPTGGYHLWFKGRLRSTAGLLGRGIDTRGEGTGYVLMPGSVIRDTPYTAERDSDAALAPDWIAGIIGEYDRRRELRSADELDTPEAIERATRWLQSRDPAVEGNGGDHWTFQTVCFVRDFGISEELAPDLLAPWNERCFPPWDDEDLQVKVENAYKYSQNEEGSKYLPPPSAAFKNVSVQLIEPPKPKIHPAFTPLTRADLAGLEEPAWLVPGWLPAQGVAIMYGAKNSYKTFTLGMTALALADRGLHVVQLIGEGGGFGIKKRIWAWEKAFQREMPATYYPIPRVPTAIEGNTKDMVATIRALGVKPDIITVDTLTRMLTGMDATAFKDMSMAYNMLEELAREFKCLVIGVGHSGKDADKGLLGSVVATANADVVIQVEGDRDQLTSKWKCKGMRNAEEPDDLRWQGEVIHTDAGKSLVFRTLTDEEREQAESAEKTDWTQADVGKALASIGAFGLGNAVTTHVLSDALLRHTGRYTGDLEHDNRAVRVMETQLKRLKHKGTIAAYCVSEPGAPMLWALPHASELQQDD